MRNFGETVVVSLALLGATTTIQARPEPGGRGGGRPPFGGPGRDKGDRRGPQNREKHHLARVWMGIGELEKGKTPLSKTQAAKIVALVLPVSKKPQLNDSDAKKLAEQIEAVLTTAQKTELRPDGPPRFGPRDGEKGNDGKRPPRGEQRGNLGARRGDHNFGPPRGDKKGEGRGDHHGPPMGFGENLTTEQREMIRDFMENHNPFYAPTGYGNWKKLPSSFQKIVAERYREGHATLESLSRKARS